MFTWRIALFLEAPPVARIRVCWGPRNWNPMSSAWRLLANVWPSINARTSSDDDENIATGSSASWELIEIGKIGIECHGRTKTMPGIGRKICRRFFRSKTTTMREEVKRRKKERTKNNNQEGKQKRKKSWGKQKRDERKTSTAGVHKMRLPRRHSLYHYLWHWKIFHTQKPRISTFENNAGRTDRRTDGPTDGPTDRRTDGRTDGRTRPLIKMRRRIKKWIAYSNEHLVPTHRRHQWRIRQRRPIPRRRLWPWSRTRLSCKAKAGDPHPRIPNTRSRTDHPEFGNWNNEWMSERIKF